MEDSFPTAKGPTFWRTNTIYLQHTADPCICIKGGIMFNPSVMNVPSSMGVGVGNMSQEIQLDAFMGGIHAINDMAKGKRDDLHQMNEDLI
jgi:hypothetical protein